MKAPLPGIDFMWNYNMLKNISSAALVILILFGTLGSGSLKGGKQEVELTGVIYVMGNEPFTQVAIKLDDGQVYALLGEHDRKLRALQGKRVLVQGKPSEEKPRGAKAIVVTSFRVIQ